jgi:phosphoribosylformylglycinamidine synthase
MTSDIKKPGSTLVLVGELSDGMGGSTYYDVAGGSSNFQPMVNLDELPAVLSKMEAAIESGKVLSCHDVSEGGTLAAVAEMCFGGDCGAVLDPVDRSNFYRDTLMFSETAGCFVVEVDDMETAHGLFDGVSLMELGKTTERKSLVLRDSSLDELFAVSFEADINELKQAWQAPMKGVFHG